MARLSGLGFDHVEVEAQLHQADFVMAACVLTDSGNPWRGEVLGLLEKRVGVHRRLIGESLTIELALDRLTKEHPDGQDTGI